MRIEGPGSVDPKRLKKTAKKSGSDTSAFAQALDENTQSEASQATQSSRAVSGVGALLGLQEVPTSTDGRSKGLARGNDMLNILEQIRRGLLLGAIPVSRLKTLATIASEQRQATADPKLDEILTEIELRAKVELAKLGY